MLYGKNILIISNEPWGDTWYSKHNYAYELSKNNRVIFLDPCDGWKPANLFGCRFQSRIIGPNLEVLKYRNRVPAFIGYNLNNRLVSTALKEYLQETGFFPYVFWSFDPYRLHDPKLAGASVSLFHCVDKFDFKSRGESRLAKNADHILLVSETFRKAYEPFNNSVHLISHAISADEFNPQQSFVLPWNNFGLYIGNIDERLDYPLIEKALKAFPETTFVFVGKIKPDMTNETAQRLFIQKEYPNLIATGEKPFKELRTYISAASFCLAFMNKNHNGNTISHHKIFQYLALGKPVFSCVFSGYSDISGLLYMDDSDDDILNKLSRFIHSGEKAELKEQRIREASKHRFDIILEQISKLTGI